MPGTTKNMKKSTASPELLLTGPEKSCGVTPQVWRAALGNVEPDPIAGIRHSSITGNEAWRLHVAEIPEKVTCHYHTCGDEIYEVVEGSGILHYGPVQKTAENVTVSWQKPLEVSAGATFSIPEWFAHQLVRTGSGPLTIIFACPDTHLGSDRFIIAKEGL